jgi:hypothetical protein
LFAVEYARLGEITVQVRIELSVKFLWRVDSIQIREWILGSRLAPLEIIDRIVELEIPHIDP